MKKFKKRSFKKRTFKKKFQKGKRPNGYRLKRSVLCATTKRCVELVFPVIVDTASATDNFYALRINGGNATMGNVLALLATNSTTNAAGVSREFTAMSKSFGSVRLIGASAQYINTQPITSAAVTRWSAMSIGLFPSIAAAAITYDRTQATLNYAYDGNMYIQPQASIISRKKFVKFPLRSVVGTNNVAANDWLVPSAMFNGQLFLSVGTPPYDPGYGLNATQNALVIPGNINVKLYFEWASPITAL